MFGLGNNQQQNTQAGQQAQGGQIIQVKPVNTQVNDDTDKIQVKLDLGTEISDLVKKVNSTPMPPELFQKCQGMIARLQKMAQSEGFSKEFEPISEYISWATSVPWGKFTLDNLDIDHARESLTKYHYGLDQVKSRIMEYLAILKLQKEGVAKVVPVSGAEPAPGSVSETPKPPSQIDISAEMSRLQGSSSHAPILCFVGIQGVGKTSMAKSIANALDRKFIRISLGGVGSATELRGRSRGEIDAEPGQIVKALIRTGVMNPLILLDEIDKVNSQTGLRADVMAALLEILDPEQNSTFMDKYVDYPLDLSQVMFITTANNLGGISAALLDRLEVIRFGSYNDNEKINIARNYLLPKVREATGLTEVQLAFDDEVWPLVIRPLGFDAGVRQLERTLTELARKIALQIVQGLTTGVKITKDNFRQYIPEDFGVYS